MCVPTLRQVTDKITCHAWHQMCNTSNNDIHKWSCRLYNIGMFPLLAEGRSGSSHPMLQWCKDLPPMILKTFCRCLLCSDSSQSTHCTLTQIRRQCAIPVFDGLFDREDNNILQLLFTCAHWHGLAKLRMHTDRTLGILDEVTTLLGVKFQHFILWSILVESLIPMNFNVKLTPAHAKLLWNQLPPPIRTWCR